AREGEEKDHGRAEEREVTHRAGLTPGRVRGRNNRVCRGILTIMSPLTPTAPPNPPGIQKRVDEFPRPSGKVHRAITKVIVGHSETVHGVMTCLFTGGHALLEGVPGLGKTLLVRTLSQVLHLAFSRIQFTPDLMPSDILGTNIINEDDNRRRVFTFQPG